MPDSSATRATELAARTALRTLDLSYTPTGDAGGNASADHTDEHATEILSAYLTF